MVVSLGKVEMIVMVGMVASKMFVLHREMAGTGRKRPIPSGLVDFAGGGYILIRN